MARVIGILNFEPSYVNVKGLEDYRPISATSILGRYRVIDFMLSNFTNSNIDVIKVLLKNRPRSVVEHISRTSYNLNSKKGKIQLLMGEQNVGSNEFYNVDINAFNTYMEFFDVETPSYVVIAPSHFIFNQDFSDMLDYHIKQKNDITMLYHGINDSDEKYLMTDVISVDKNDRVVGMSKNRGKFRYGNISLESYVMDFNTFKQLVEEAAQVSSLYSLSDIIADNIKIKKVGAYEHKGYFTCISTLKEYYEANMNIRKEEELTALINDSWPIYTMTNDSCPTLYRPSAKVKGSIVANGCQIEGTVINSVIGRNVTIKEGAVIKDSVILPDTLIDKNVKLTCAVVDRLAIVTHVKEIAGTKENPQYIKRGDRI